jgi:hypothetical protein
MIAYLELVFRRDCVLLLFDRRVDELFYLAAVQTNDVIMMLAFVQFKYGCHSFEVMPGDQSSGLKLRQHPINRRQTNVLMRLQQMTIDIFRTHVPWLCAAQNVQDFETRHGDFEPRFAQIAGFHDKSPLKGSTNELPIAAGITTKPLARIGLNWL